MNKAKISKCLIVDDELLDGITTANHIKKLASFEILGVFNSSVEAYEFLQTNSVDVLFLDIHMPDLNGLDLIKSLSYKPYIIIISASRDFAVESYELEVNDYLLKPLTFPRLLKSAQRYLNYIDKQKDIISNNQNNSEQEYIQVKENYKTVKINIQEISYIESFREYVHIHCHEKLIKTKLNMHQMESMLEQKGFLRIHKSFLINLSKIKSYSSKIVEMENEKLPIGRFYQKQVLNEMQK